MFPHVVDGGGYRTEFILPGTGGAAAAALAFHGRGGRPIEIGTLVRR